ncbi:hypothetical protein [Vallicoccus soli]|uniref:Uncharacterized protein n=1 Tax=Vallicoccus soli TaxID=2339232 RepID=A0A3A3YY28_9ACTN|nr:hypothetical protein [Vallicoccus soli]RJK92947.1 hypothetical protein D5H78_17735 [Vallicoccus soli]
MSGDARAGTQSGAGPAGAVAGGGPAADPVRRLGDGGRAARALVTLVVAVLLTAGTFWGDDDAFPFGPFRMYSTSSNTTGAISVAAIEARTDGGTWEPAHLNPWTVGMNRAEVEGQLDRIQADPALLGKLAEARDRLQPGAEPWTGMRLLRVSTVVVDTVPTGEERRQVLAEWSR